MTDTIDFQHHKRQYQLIEEQRENGYGTLFRHITLRERGAEDGTEPLAEFAALPDMDTANIKESAVGILDALATPEGLQLSEFTPTD